jgi:DNA ligase-associated metallophosphoesterase
VGSFPFRVNGADLEAHPAGVLWWPARRVLAVADMHLEKGSSYAHAGVFLPPYDSIATVKRLQDVVEALSPVRIIAMGDSFHDTDAEARLDPAAAALLLAQAKGREWIWLRGNHDPTPSAGLGGEVVSQWVEGPLVFRHEPTAQSPGEVAGHLHPKLRVNARGRSIAARCFVTDGRQLILPAFGELTGGLSARDRDVRRVFGKPLLALLVGPTKVHPVSI